MPIVIVIGLGYVLLMSLLPDEAHRRRLSGVTVAGTGAAYLGGGARAAGSCDPVIAPRCLRQGAPRGNWSGAGR
ncbi:DUF6010 family protein [Streptomyces sp. NPDC001100]